MEERLKEELRDAEGQKQENFGWKERLEQEKLDRQKREEEAHLKSYTSVFEGATMLSNTAVNGSATDEAARDFEDDFM